MYFKTKIAEFDSLIHKYLILPGESSEQGAVKIYFFRSIVTSIPGLFLFGLLFWLIDKPTIATAFWIFTTFELFITVIIFLCRKRFNSIVLINQYFFVIFSFAATLYFGGILYSGGIVFVGLAGALLSLSFFTPIQIRYIFIVYILTVIAEAFLQPLLVPLPELTPRLNLILFVLHFLVVSFSMYMTLSNYLEQNIQAKKKEADHLKELDEIKTKFYTNITHEFRTPLTVILGLTNPSVKMTPSRLKKNITLIRRNGNRLLQLVNQMLDLSKLEANSMIVNYVQSDVIPFIHNVIEPFIQLANDKNIRIQFISKLKKLNMDFDPEKMESILSNLLSNALKYTPKNGSIIFSLSIMSTEKSRTNYGYSPLPELEKSGLQFLKIQITDNGPGIVHEELPLIFNRFYQVKSGSSNQYEGSGIGLLLVKELINLLRGTIFISSEPGEGTLLTVLLPISNEAPTSNYLESISTDNSVIENHTDFQSNVHEEKETTELPHLLIIEDNDDVATYITTVTENYYLTFRAENGILGIEMALENVPDIIISDILMPGKNGYEVCATLKKDFRTSHIPVILLTAKTDKTSQIAGYEKGTDAYITKPFEPRELLIRLEKLIEIRETLKAKYKTLALVSEIDIEKTTDPEELFLLQTKKIMDKYYAEDNFTPGQLSEQLGVSRSQLFRKLKALTGLSASRFINYYRLSVAKLKIQKTSLTISEIAYEVGFKDPAYFTRLFSKEFGSSPAKFRRDLS